jgi:hypothetical protein
MQALAPRPRFRCAVDDRFEDVILDRDVPSEEVSSPATQVTGRTSGARDNPVPALLAATIRVNQNSLSSASAHPEQVEAPEGDEDQGARAHAQQQYNCFQHDRITPLVSQKHARLS